MDLDVFEVLEKAAKQRTKAKKVEVLKQNESWPLKDVIRGSYDSTIEWDLPAGDPPYTPSEAHNHPSSILREHKKFVYFVKGTRASKSIPKFKRERIFLEIIEGVHPSDAKHVIDMVNKRPIKNLTRPIIEEAFPGLLRDNL